MKLTEEQKRQVAARLADGASISEIQKLVNEDFKIHMTYMEVRFLLDDLDLNLAPPPPQPAPDQAAELLDPDAPDQAYDEDLPSAVTVEIDRVVRPGAAVSGTVVFSDGARAKWVLDTYGRLALEPAQEGYKPPPEDIREFQLQLQSKLR